MGFVHAVTLPEKSVYTFLSLIILSCPEKIINRQRSALAVFQRSYNIDHHTRGGLMTLLISRAMLPAGVIDNNFRNRVSNNITAVSSTFFQTPCASPTRPFRARRHYPSPQILLSYARVGTVHYVSKYDQNARRSTRQVFQITKRLLARTHGRFMPYAEKHKSLYRTIAPECETYSLIY